MKEYQVNTTLSNGSTINSGTIIIPDGRTAITCNNQNVKTLDLTNVTFQPRYEVESSAKIDITANNSVKWDPVKVTGTNVLGNWISGSNSLIELGMGNSTDITLTKSTDPTNGEYLQWVLSQDIKDDIAGKQDRLVSRINIKTINGQSILGSGDLPISGGGGGSNIQIYHVYQSLANGVITLDLFPSGYDLSANYTIMFITWFLNYGGEGRYYNTKFTYGYDHSLYNDWFVYIPEHSDKKPSFAWGNQNGVNLFNINSAGAKVSTIDIVAISIPKT